MRKLIPLAALLVALASCAKHAPTIALMGEHTPDQAKIARQAIDTFTGACAPLAADLHDAKQAEAKIVDAACEWDQRCQAYGWHKQLVVTVTMRDDADQAAGQTLTYYLGAGKRPGILAQKPAAQRLCAMPTDADRDVLKPAPALAALDHL